MRHTARRVFLDPSTPSSWTVVRVVLVAFLVWNLGGFVIGIVSSLTFLFFIIVLSVFFAYLIDPLVKLIVRFVDGDALRITIGTAVLALEAHGPIAGTASALGSRHFG